MFYKKLLVSKGFNPMAAKKVQKDSQNEFLKDFFDNASIGFHVFGSDRVIIDINEAELHMIGYRREEVVGEKTWADLIVPVEIPLFEKHWQEIHSKGEVRNLNYTLVSKSGQHIHVLLNASARFDASGKLVNTRGSVVDITHRYQMARALWLSKQELSKQKLTLEKNNMALFGWLDRRDAEKRGLRDRIQKNIEETVLPLIERLKRHGTALDQRNVMLLEKALNDLTDEFSVKLMGKKWKLSAREIEICKMLKGGLNTKDIADLLCTSIRTVEHHRNHIRKKLGITKPGMDLVEHLRAFFFAS